MNRSHRHLSYLLFLLITCGAVFPCFALDLEAGLWNHIPLGSNFVGGAYAYTEADIVANPVLLHSDGTTHVIFEPLDFISKLASLVPKPRVNLTRFHN